MISPFVSKLSASCKWILAAAAAWTCVLVFVSRATVTLREHGSHSEQPQGGPDTLAPRIAALNQENRRLREELKTLPALRARSQELSNTLSSSGTSDRAQWTGRTEVLKEAVEREQREVDELQRWSSQWHQAKTREAALARLAEKARKDPIPRDQERAGTQETLRQFALAQKKLMETTRGWARLSQAEKDQARPRLEQVQAEWMAANEKLGKDSVLYETLPLPGNIQDARAVLFMRSVAPDASGEVASVFLDGTVTFSKE